MNPNITIHEDFDLFTKIINDPSYANEKRIAQTAIELPWPIGKLYFAKQYPQILQWAIGKPQAAKMAYVYLTAKEYLIQSGIPRELLDITATMFDALNGKPIAPDFLKAVQLLCLAWHARCTRMYPILLEEFKSGNNVVSQGCGCSIIEQIALIASKSKTAKLTLIDKDPASTAIARDLKKLFIQNGYDIDNQVEILDGDIRDYEPSSDVDTVVTIGLLYNYFSISESNAIIKKLFTRGINTVVADYCCDPAELNDEAKLRMAATVKIVGWKGLLLCTQEEFRNSLPDNIIVDLYDQYLTATVVMSSV